MTSGIVITFADITAAKNMEAQLRETNEKLASHSSAQSRSLKLAIRRLEKQASKGEAAGPKISGSRKSSNSPSSP